MRKLTIQEMQKLAKSKGGKCLSPVYINIHHKLEWECANGHQWKALPSSIRQGFWCARCAVDRRKNSLDEMRELATVKGGRCLSVQYVNSKTPLEWGCSAGHVWRAKPNTIKQGSWCPECAGKIRTLEDMRHLAESRGGKCLSSQYINAYTKLEWECAKGHRWWAKPNRIQQGRWCYTCSGKTKRTIEDMRQLAQSRGGKCLSNQFVNVITTLQWECAQGHRWLAKPSNVLQGTWCVKCVGLDKKTVHDMTLVAQERGGKFISQEYINDSTPHEWECAEGHRWRATPNSIKRGQWCPECADNLSERICRAHFEQLFGSKFPSRKPKWLRSSRDTRMELDGYCEKLGIAFEYQGVQHYKKHRRSHPSDQDFLQRGDDDKRKRELCTTHHVKFIVIPYTVPYDKMKSFILESCQILAVKLPPDAHQKNIDISRAYSPRKIDLMQELAKKNGGRCLSKLYGNVYTKLQWECHAGHRWWTSPNTVQQGHWCPECAGKKEKTLQDLISIAERHGGECLSTTFKGMKKKYEWQCKRGHRWEASAINVMHGGTWCSHCAGKAKKTIEQMRALADDKGGKCLSSEYKGGREKLLWQCREGHTWMTAPEIVQQGSWCPVCANKIKRVATGRKGASG